MQNEYVIDTFLMEKIRDIDLFKNILLRDYDFIN